MTTQGESSQHPHDPTDGFHVAEQAQDEALQKYGERITEAEERELSAEVRAIADERFKQLHGISWVEAVERAIARENASNKLVDRAIAGEITQDELDAQDWDGIFFYRSTEAKIKGIPITAENLAETEEERRQFEIIIRETQTQEDYERILEEALRERATAKGYIFPGGSFIRFYRLKPDTPNEVLELFGVAPGATPRTPKDGLARKMGLLIHLPAHNLTNKAARHFGGREVAPYLEDGSIELHAETRDGRRETAALLPFPGEHVERAYGQDAALLLSSNVVKPVIERAFREHKEIKAKTFLGALSLATDSDNPALFKVDLRDFMAALGYDRKNTRSDYYDKHFASVIKTLEVDLSNIMADLTSYDGRGNKRHYHGRLMTLWGYEGDQLQIPGTELTMAMMTALRDDDDAALIAMVKRRRPTTVKIGFDPEALAALGVRIGKDTASQLIPRPILGLRGPAFWLAMRILPMLRWTKGEVQPHQGAILAEELDELGYIADTFKSGKERPADALRNWANDVGKLVDMGALDPDGSGFHAYQYDQTAARWKEITATISDLIQGGRVTKAFLGSVRIVYELPKGRIEERTQANQRRKKFIGNGGDSNQGKKKSAGRPKARG